VGPFQHQLAHLPAQAMPSSPIPIATALHFAPPMSIRVRTHSNETEQRQRFLIFLGALVRGIGPLAPQGEKEGEGQSARQTWSLACYATESEPTETNEHCPTQNPTHPAFNTTGRPSVAGAAAGSKDGRDAAGEARQYLGMSQVMTFAISPKYFCVRQKRLPCDGRRTFSH